MNRAPTTTIGAHHVTAAAVTALGTQSGAVQTLGGLRSGGVNEPTVIAAGRNMSLELNRSPRDTFGTVGIDTD